MKKLFLFFIVLLVGCSGKEQGLDYYKLSKELDEIKTSNLNIEKSLTTIQNELLDDDLNDIHLDLEKYIDLSILEEYVFYQNDNNYIFIYKTDKDIKEKINNYFNDLLKESLSISLREQINDRIEYKYEDYYIYIVSDKKTDILEKILETKILLFEETTRLEKDEIKEKFDIEIPNSIIKLSTKLDLEQGYLIIENASNEIEQKCDNYFKNNYLKIKKHNLLIYIISSDNNIALEVIEKFNEPKQ